VCLADWRPPGPLAAVWCVWSAYSSLQGVLRVACSAQFRNGSPPTAIASFKCNAPQVVRSFNNRMHFTADYA
jgi:hypothetical protein